MSTSKISAIKHGFFDKSLKKKHDISFKENDFDINQFQEEFHSLYQLFISNKQHWLKEKEIVSYMYYMCILTGLYYQYDYVNEDLQKLSEKRIEIEQYISKHFSKKEQASISERSNKLKSYFTEHQASFISISKLRKYAAMLNANRSYWGYSRALANHAILYFQTHCPSHFNTTANDMIGEQCISQEIINLLNKSREPLVILGITLHSLRFTINFSLLIKHVVEAARNNELSTKNVLMHELEKRGFTMASDLVWAIVTLLTNYNVFFQISKSAVAPIIVGFLGFDALLFLAQLTTEAVKYNQRMLELISQEESATPLERIVIRRQIDLLNDEWEVKTAYYFINILAANLIIIGFGMSLLCTGPFVLAGLSLMCSLGNALYNTTDKFKTYQQARIAVQRELSNGKILNDEHHQKLIIELHKEFERANIDFWNTLAITTTGTAFIITAAVISWPIALSLTLSYIAYRLYEANNGNSVESGKQELIHDIYRFFKLNPSDQLPEISPLPLQLINPHP